MINPASFNFLLEALNSYHASWCSEQHPDITAEEVHVLLDEYAILKINAL